MTTRSITVETYERLKDELLSARRAPGAKLKIDGLSKDFGVSPGAVREALARLSSDGLVCAEPQRGFVVAPVSAADLVDLIAVRIEIETRCLRRAIVIGDVAWEGRILSALHQLKRVPTVDAVAGEPSVMSSQWARLHGEFHDSLIAACDSRWWLRLRDQVFLQAERYRRLLIPYARIERDAEAEHQAIGEAAVARRADLACDLMTEHLQTTADMLLASAVPFEDLSRS